MSSTLPKNATGLQAIHLKNRITGELGIAMRQCFHCEDIVRTKRSG